MKKRIVLLLTVMFCLAVTALVGCGQAGNGQKASGTNAAGGGSGDRTQLNVGVELFSATLESADVSDSWYIIRFGAGETLVRFDDDGNTQPWLAESWEVADDNLTWTFKIREGVKFSNGKDMLASDVVESIERLFELEDPSNGGNGGPQGHFTYSSITADDEAYTVTIVTEKLTPDLPGCLAYPWSLIIDVEGSAERDIPTQGAIYTGPYAIASFTQDSDMQMVKNEYYWDGEVPFETVNIMKIGEPSTRTMALQDGSVDLTFNVPATDLATLANAGGFEVIEVVSARTAYTHINVSGVMGNDALRQAVMMAVDGKTIADVTTSGAYEYGYAQIPSSLDYGYDSLSYEFGYNPDAAMKILDAAGIVDSDGDGYRELDGQMIDLDYRVTANRQMDKIAQAEAAQLEEIGIKVTVQVTESHAEILHNHMFDLACSNEVVTPTGDPAKYMSHWYSLSDDNYSLYKNTEYDAIYEELVQETLPETRRDFIVQLQQILLDDAQSLVYGYYNYNVCTVEGLTGINKCPNDFYWISKDIKFV